MGKIVEEDDIPATPASASRLQNVGHDVTALSPTGSASAVKECSICHKELSWFSRKRKCDLCNTVTCKQCCSKKTIPGTVACRNCLERRNLRREVTEESTNSPPSSPKIDTSGEPLVGASGAVGEIPKGYFGYVQVRMVEGRGFVAADTNILGQKTTSDPYAVVTLSMDRTRRSTRVISSTLNPVWNETLEMPVRFPVQNLEIAFYDKDVAGSDDYIGRVIIPLDRLPNGKPLTGWLPLVYSKDMDDLSPDAAFGDPSTSSAGGVFLSVRLDYKIRSELRGYIRGSVAEPPQQKIKFDINQLYGPGMLAVDLLWTRMLSPIVNVILYVLFWENFVVSTIAMFLWISIAYYVEYWPSAIFFALDIVMVYNYIRRTFRALSHPLESPAESSKSLKKLAKIPGIKQAGAAGKGIIDRTGTMLARGATKALTDGTGSNKTTPKPQPTAPAEEDLPPDYEEQSLSSVVGKLMMVSPGWLKEMLGAYQPLARKLADLSTMLYDIFQGNHDLSIYVFMVFLILGIGLVYIPYRYFMIAAGLLVIFVMSPLMSILMGVIGYLQRPKRFNDPALIGMWKAFDHEWTSQDAVNHARKKKNGRGFSSLNL